jgi:phage tail sheath gpL-like
MLTVLATLAAILAASVVGISFNSIPTNLRVPFLALEFDGSAAQQGPALLPYRCLIIGQKITSGSPNAGTGVANTLYKVTTADQVRVLGGAGSCLHNQAKAWFKNNQFTETWIGVLDDNGAGVAATGTLTFTGPTTAAGTVSLYLAGRLVSVGVASGQTATQVASAVSAAINLVDGLPATASPSTGVVTVTYRHKGAIGNDFDMRANYNDGEKLPAGLTLAVAAMSAGATNPVLTTLIAAMGDRWFHITTVPYTDATSLTALETEFDRRFGPMTMIDGIFITSAVGSQATLGTLGGTRNSKYGVIVPQPGTNPLTPPMEFAAATAAACAYFANIDPARPLQTIPLVGVLPPADGDLFTLTERNLNLFEGISATKAAAGGVVQIERLITTYQLSAAGSPDTAYLDVTTMLTNMYLRYSFRNQILNRYPRHKLASDGTYFGPGQKVITPLIGKAEAINWFRQMEQLGLVENFDQFKNDLVCARSLTDPNRLEWMLPPDIMNQFIVGAAVIQFRL